MTAVSSLEELIILTLSVPFEIPLDLNHRHNPNKDVRKKLHGNCEKK